MDAGEIIRQLESLANPANVAGMARYAIVTPKAFGVAAPDVKKIAQAAKKANADRHQLALDLWKSGFHEARAVAYLVDDSKQVSRKQMDSWVKDFDNWAICDGTCGHLFCKTEFAYEKAFEWGNREEEFVKRAGLVLPAWLAIHDKKTPDEKLAEFLPFLESKSVDDRNFVKKAVNWSLRGIGKRSIYLNSRAINTAERIAKRNSRSARWIASDALRELRSEKVYERLVAKEARKTKT